MDYTNSYPADPVYRFQYLNRLFSLRGPAAARCVRTQSPCSHHSRVTTGPSGGRKQISRPCACKSIACNSAAQIIRFDCDRREPKLLSEDLTET